MSNQNPNRAHLAETIHRLLQSGRKAEDPAQYEQRIDAAVDMLVRVSIRTADDEALLEELMRRKSSRPRAPLF